MIANCSVVMAFVALLLAPGAALAQDDARSQEGQQVFARWCAGCHARGTPVQSNPNGNLIGRVWAGTYALEQRFKGSVPAALEDRTNLTPDFVRFIVRNGLNAMPRTRKTEISDEKLDALVGYLTRTDRAASEGARQ